ncbi:DUF3899 domain-containing protein [Sutcliffiella rhizosphaerae]|uniref:DUF3899 domain-containing protein n=1 Tax=Sutcliffiella rhizosphaerae TaxID=2880967 RepID=A0ABN8AIY3_9BACI|nr:DUF3899 domain-containing protein [Sutcliffiella rhizosphaerae]CAG9622855.1 hypothetical protein BACCIP111883_03646 [Sutcliffiella rhizosphaerae]
MNKSVKSSLTIFIFLFIITMITTYLYYGVINLLTFINTSFIFSSIIIFLSLLLLITKKGFFDGITYGFRRIFATSQYDKELEEDIKNEMRPPSEITRTISSKPLLIAGLILFIFMLISLFFFYNN